MRKRKSQQYGKMQRAEQDTRSINKRKKDASKEEMAWAPGEN
jgi:hypothetical protein